MGISLNAWRTAIGTFLVKDRPLNKFKIPKHSFNENFNGFWGRSEWARYLYCSKYLSKTRIMQNKYFGLVILSWTAQCLLLISGDVHPNPGPECKENFRKISICHSNIRSLKQVCDTSGASLKLDHIKCHLVDRFDIITLSETWLTNSDSNDKFNLPGYQKPFRLDRTCDIGTVGYGGVLAWVSTKLACKRRMDLEIAEIEAMWLEIRSSNIKFFVCTLYKTSSNSDRTFWDKMQDMIAPLFEIGATFIILGDINADPFTPEGRKLTNFVNTNELYAYIKEPTRITNTSSTIVDQIISNRPGIVKSVLVEPPISLNDHCNISASLSFSKPKAHPYKRIMWDYKNGNFELFREKLSAFDWDSCLKPEYDIDKMTDLWSNAFLKIAKSSIPTKVVTMRPNDKPWYSNILRLKRKRMIQHFKAFKSQKTDTKWADYKQIRNEYFNDIKAAKKSYDETNLQSLIDQRNSSKQWWSLIKQINKCNSFDGTIPPLDTGGELISDDKQKANAFNDYFLEASTLDETNATVPQQHRIIGQHDLTNIVISELDVLDQLTVLDPTKAYGVDGIPPKLLREAGKSISQSVCKLFNFSLSKTKVPSNWKKSNIVPIFKKDDASIINNYRPISLLSSVSKLMERIIFKYIANFFKDNFVLTDNQSGFQSGRSTVTQLIELYHQLCKSLEAGKEVRVIFLDISKAFDRVWHAGLLHKLKLAGINGNLLNWLTDYLKDRYQRVTINGQHSEWGVINAGVPQGSVLGPLLFLVFINDIVNEVNACNVRLFADDTCIFLEVDNREETAVIINENLQKIDSWANKWLINFSAPKTKVLTVSNKRDAHRNPPLIFKNVNVEEVASHVYLGVRLSSDLTWKKHVADLAEKGRKKLNAMLSLKYKLDRYSLEIMYTCFVRSTFDYASVLWGGTYKSDILKLEQIQIDAMRLITGATARSNKKSLYNETKLITLQQRITNTMLTLMYKILHNLCPTYLSNLVKPNEDDKIYNLRSQAAVKVPFARLETFKRSFIPHTCVLWNSLPVHIQNAGSLEDFKQFINLTKENCNKLYYYGKRWPSINHARLRIGCSKLKGDLCNNLHVENSSRCDCGFELEDASHFFLDCPLYAIERQQLITTCQQFSDPTLNLFLYGHPDLTLQQNQEMFLAVHLYFEQTKRFE